MKVIIKSNRYVHFHTREKSLPLRIKLVNTWNITSVAEDGYSALKFFHLSRQQYRNFEEFRIRGKRSKNTYLVQNEHRMSHASSV